MASYVVRLDDRSATETFADLSVLLAQWESFGCTLHPLAPGTAAPRLGTPFDSPSVFFRTDIATEWTSRSEWHRLRWLYYCDDANGISLRLYDRPHFSVYAPGGYYIEPASGSDPNDHYEKVIVRGYCMGHEPSGLESSLRGLRVCHFLHHRPIVPVGNNLDLLIAEIADPYRVDLLLPDVEVLMRSMTLKLRIRAASHWVIWPASHAPNSFTEDRHPLNIDIQPDLRLDYFQHPNRNNVPVTPPIS
jgi:hypothetical protein